MKKILLFIMLLSATCASAQDVIVKKDGSTILSKVIEIGTSEIKYKKYSNQNGPTYTINKAEIMSINYENGEKDVFEVTVESSESTINESPRYVESVADSRNSELISLYNREYKPSNKVKEKDVLANFGITILGIRKNSIMSNEDLEMKIVRKLEYLLTNGMTGAGKYVQRFYINITNKSDKIIYIDKGNSFRLNSNGEATCYYDPTEQVITNHGGGKGASIGLGSVANVLGIGGTVGKLASGVSIGGSSSHSISNMYSQQRIIAIPPHGNKNLTEVKWTEGKKRDKRKLEDAEYFPFSWEDANTLGVIPIGRGEIKKFDENDISWNREYYITYSKDENFRSYSSLHVGLYIKEIIGIGNECGDYDDKRHAIKREECIINPDEYTIFTEIPIYRYHPSADYYHMNLVED